MKIHGLNKLTLLDYPGHMACLIFTGACNYRCPFCHNASLVLNPNSQPAISEEEIFSFLQSRKDILEGVCISGGEPTLQSDLPEFIRKIRAMGFHVKLDTNGSRPGILKSLLDEGLLDYVSMDIKNAPKKYLTTIGIPAETDSASVPGDEGHPFASASGRNTSAAFSGDCSQSNDIPGFHNLITDSVRQSAELLMQSGIPYEFRTTVVKELHDEADLLTIGKWLNGASAYYLQSFRDSETLVGAAPGQFHAYGPEQMHAFRDLLKPYFETVELRGID